MHTVNKKAIWNNNNNNNYYYYYYYDCCCFIFVYNLIQINDFFYGKQHYSLIIPCNYYE